jgi:hypothetical protein
MQALESMSNDCSVQALTHVNTVSVATHDLQRALEPEPPRCIAAVHALTPKLAGLKYDALMSVVTNATGRLNHKPQSVADAVEHVQFMASCESDRGRLDSMFDEVEEHYNLCKVHTCLAVRHSNQFLGCLADGSIAHT